MKLYHSQNAASVLFPGYELKPYIIMWLQLVIIFLMLMYMPTLAFGEFYRYTDENGAIRFTDNIAEVPENQRVRAYKGDSSPEGEIPGASDVTEGSEAVVSEKKEDAKETPKEAMFQEYQKLQEDKAALENEYKEKGEKLTPEEAKDYMNRVKQYEESVSAYEEKRKALEKIDAEQKAAIEAAAKAAREAKEKAVNLGSQEKPQE